MKTKLMQIQIPLDLHDALRKLAVLERRSMTAQACVLIADGVAKHEEARRQKATA